MSLSMNAVLSEFVAGIAAVKSCTAESVKTMALSASGVRRVWSTSVKSYSGDRS